MSNTIQTQEAKTENKPAEAKQYNPGEGKYRQLKLECYRDSQVVFGLDNSEAETLAEAIARDFGRHLGKAQVGLSDVTVGKANKDGHVTLKEAANSIKGVPETPALFALRALRYAADCGKYGFVWAKTTWAIGDEFRKQLAEIK